MSKQTSAPTSAQTTDAAVKSTVEALVAGTPADESGYAALDRSGKGRVRSAIEARSKSTIATADPTDPEAAMAALVEARRLAGIAEGLKSVRSHAAPADPTVALANRIATLRLAADLLESGMVGDEPIEFDPGTVRQIATRADVAVAYQLAEKSVTRSAPTHKVEEGLRIAFADEPVGTFLKVGEIAKRWHAAGGPAGADGRIAARLFAESGCTVTFVEPTPATADTGRGATLTEEV